MSGGQKSRVAFAKITFKKPHIVLLDEPSNHLVSHYYFLHFFNFLLILLVVVGDIGILIIDLIWYSWSNKMATLVL